VMSFDLTPTPMPMPSNGVYFMTRVMSFLSFSLRFARTAHLLLNIVRASVE